MMTIGGQTFAKAYANTVLQYCGGIAGLAGGNCAGNAGAVTAQPFFEKALAGTGYCKRAPRTALRRWRSMKAMLAVPTSIARTSGVCGAIWIMAGSTSRAP